MLRKLMSGTDAWSTIARDADDDQIHEFILHGYQEGKPFTPYVPTIELPASGSVHWTADGWSTILDTETVDSGLGMHYADLDTADLAVNREVVFTIHWPAEGRWEGVNHTLRVN